ncbi:hypothetical protein [Dyadobacter sp. Leaf189]|uniref:hypothetical protein n=1 Tax=Dyadobacter sp. Leaf189 TaxID=1736295 RepID=UPI0006FE53D1|nr:hypothetical protein [Dyadobacter sp. Leaf189]KQS27099.1 hypothetical protein ASG33_21450 [Dyadobacter sp. Leaf189]
MPRLVSGLIIGLVIALYLLYNLFFSVNFPFQDDFLIIQFIQAASEGGFSFDVVLHQMFLTFNDHKATTIRFIALVEYALTGHQNFRFYIVLVSLNVIYIFSFLYIQFRKTKLPLYYFIPAPFLFFTPLFHEVSGWALNGMQHSFLTAFTVTAILLASRRTTVTFWLAMVFCLLATFTHGNGVLSFPAVVFYFLCFKDFKKATLATISMIACLAIYLIGYERGQAGHLPTDLISMLSSLFGFIGSSMSLWAGKELWSALWGIFIVGIMLVLTLKVAAVYFDKPSSVKPGSIELLSLFAFIFITSAVIALFRSWTGSTIASRFQLYAAMSTVICYIILLDYTSFFRKKQVLITVSVLSVFYWMYAHYVFTATVASKKTTYLADVYNWKNNRDMFSVEKSITRNADFYLRPGYEKGFFRLPEPVISEAALNEMFAKGAGGKTADKMYLEDWKVTRMVTEGPELLTHYFVGSNDEPFRKSLLSDRFLVLKNVQAGAVHLMNANAKVEARKQILTTGNYYKPGFNTFLRKDDLAPGIYQLAILDVDVSGETQFYLLDKSLVAKGGGFTLQ